MASILYVETNFPRAIAKGQDPDADDLLSNVPDSLRIVIPAICFVEALSSWTSERKQREKFLTEAVDPQRREVERDELGADARELRMLLESSRAKFGEWLNDLERRLNRALAGLAERAEMIELAPDIVQDAFKINLVGAAVDNLILACVIYHARSRPEDAKAFLSGNFRDFAKPEVDQALGEVGVKYFRRTAAALGWLQSQAGS